MVLFVGGAEMIIFYKDCFFPVGHVDQGKPIPLGLCGQLGSRPHTISKAWLDYKALMVEFDLKGYSHFVRNGDDPIQVQLRQDGHIEIDDRSFEELYQLGLAKIGITAPAQVADGILPTLRNYTQHTIAAVSAFNSFRQEHPRLQALVNDVVLHMPIMHTAQAAVTGASSLLQLARSTKEIFKS